MKNKRFVELKECFSRALESQFAVDEVSNEPLPSGCALYELADARGENVRFFVLLLADPKTDRFTVEIAWSLKDRFPTYYLPGFLSDSPRDGEFRFRVGEFWGDHDYWWIPHQQVVPSGVDKDKIDNAARAAVGKLKDYLPEYIDEVCSTAGRD